MSSCTSSSRCKTLSPLFSTGDPGEVGDAGDEGRVGKTGSPGHTGLYDIISVPINRKSVPEGLKKRFSNCFLPSDSILRTQNSHELPVIPSEFPKCVELLDLRTVNFTTHPGEPELMRCWRTYENFMWLLCWWLYHRTTYKASLWLHRGPYRTSRKGFSVTMSSK